MNKQHKPNVLFIIDIHETFSNLEVNLQKKSKSFFISRRNRKFYINSLLHINNIKDTIISTINHVNEDTLTEKGLLLDIEKSISNFLNDDTIFRKEGFENKELELYEKLNDIYIQILQKTMEYRY